MDEALEAKLEVALGRFRSLFNRRLDAKLREMSVAPNDIGKNVDAQKEQHIGRIRRIFGVARQRIIAMVSWASKKFRLIRRRR